MDPVAGKAIRVLVSCKSDAVYQLLDTRDDVRYDIALHTGPIRAKVADVQLIIIDDEDVVEYPDPLRDIHEAIFEARVLECRSDEFLAKPDDYLGGLAMNKPGAMLSLPTNYCLALVSYSGGTGRSTLGLDTAFRFAEAVNGDEKQRRRREREAEKKRALAPMLVEMTFGVSSLISLTGVEMPALMHLSTNADVAMQRYRGVDCAPMDYDNVRVLSDELLGRYFGREMAKHSLTIVEGTWPHSQSKAIADKVDLWVVTASPRDDTISNAQRLYDDLATAYGEDRVWTLQNKVPDLDERSQAPLNWDVRVPLVPRPEEYKGDMGQVLLSRVFAPIWKEFTAEKKSGLFS